MTCVHNITIVYIIMYLYNFTTCTCHVSVALELGLSFNKCTLCSVLYSLCRDNLELLMDNMDCLAGTCGWSVGGGGVSVYEKQGGGIVWKGHDRRLLKIWCGSCVVCNVGAIIKGHLK